VSLWKAASYAISTRLSFLTIRESAYGLLNRDRGAQRIDRSIIPTMRFEDFTFGSIRIDGVTYEHDVVIDRGQVCKRKKKPSKKFRGEFGHTPLSLEEKIPWKCRRLVVGTGTGALPVMEELKREAKRRKIELLILPTVRAIEILERDSTETNAVLHVTC
jgi:hypothetical protein